VYRRTTPARQYDAFAHEGTVNVSHHLERLASHAVR
jgi:hypothetical protein